MIAQAVLERLKCDPEGFPLEVAYLLEEDAEKIGRRLSRRYSPRPYHGLEDVLRLQMAECPADECFPSDVIEAARQYEQRDRQKLDSICGYLQRRSAAYVHDFFRGRIPKVWL